MSEYRGKQALQNYMRNNRVPYFNDFITENKTNFMLWLDYRHHMEPMALFKLWRSRFALALRDHKKLEMIVEGKGTYNKAFWEDVLKGAKALHDAKVTSTVNAIETAVMATAAATTLLAESFAATDNELIADSSTASKESTTRTAPETASPSHEATSTSTITPATGDDTIASAHLTWSKIPADDHELRFHYLAHKKSSSSALLSEEETLYLSDYKSNGSPKADLLLLCAPLLLKEELTGEEDALLELSLSGIYNYLNPYMKKVYQEKLNRSPPSTITTTTTDTNSVAEAMTCVRNLLDSEKDMDDILYKVQLEKARLVKEKLRHSDMYKALAILEKVIEDTQLWNEAGDEQEMTFYRRFASYLDTLLIKTDLNMIDGETGCSSSKIAIETNKQLFHIEDSSATYARKIDLILRYNDRKNVDLCSNEWKRSKVTSDLKLKQQSKNLRINATIMDSLHAFGTSASSLLAIDMIGLHGYIYRLTKVDDYFFATPYSILVIPRRFADIACIENTLLALFRFKHFYTSLIPALRKRIATNEMYSDIGSVCEMNAAVSDSTHVSQNFIFFKSRKRKHGTSELEDDN